MRMRATLIYNPRSGSALAENEILDQLEDIGWQVDRSMHKKQLDDCICHEVDVVVVAAGDGTVGKVAKRLAGTATPMAIVPMGTANNVARSLGLGVEASTAVLALRRAAERRIDLGIVSSARRRDYFLEGFGVGVFAYVMGEKAGKADKKLRRALGFIAEELEEYEPRRFELDVDGADCSGKYVLAEVMNARSLGPALTLAPEAKCDDGELDVVLVRPEAKRALVAHLRRAADEGDIALPTFETIRARRVSLRADGHWAHIDDQARQLEGATSVTVATGAVKVLAPPQSPTHASPQGG
jgi:diacylglycerol kinase family enzyme